MLHKSFALFIHVCCHHLLFAVTKNTADNQKTILHESAKAGLASTENFKSVVLRKTRKAPDGTAMAEDDENYVMSRPSLVVAQIKGTVCYRYKSEWIFVIFI